LIIRLQNLDPQAPTSPYSNGSVKKKKSVKQGVKQKKSVNETQE
jgi:hypothetical protein